MISERLQHKLVGYAPSTEAIALINAVPIVFLVGISGAGKDTVKHELLKLPRYHHIVSHTTRPPRRNRGVLEQEGVDYHFIDYDTAEHMLDNHGYVEAKRYGNNIYGTSVGEFQLSHDEAKIAITDLEVQGVEEYMAIAPATVRPIFLLPPTYAVWRQRTLQRYGDDHQDHSDDIALRMEAAKAELAHLLETEYFRIIINEDLQKTVAAVNAIAEGADQSAGERAEALAVAKQIFEQLA